MKKVFLDTNFIMDLLARESDFSVPAKQVLRESAKHDITFFVSFLSVANFAYIMRKEPKEKLHEQIRLICKLFKVTSNTEVQLTKALEHSTKDYEDAVQYETAVSNDCNCIITRNAKHYKFSVIPIYSPQEFWEYLTSIS